MAHETEAADPFLVVLGVVAAVFIVGFVIFATFVLIPYWTEIGEQTKACMHQGGAYINHQCAVVMK